jgi:HlyD family secretion protein
VDEADIGRVVLEQEATFTVDSYPGQSFSGRVVQVRQAPQVIQNVVTYDTVVAVPNPDVKLKPGMTANVKILVARRDNAVLIPNAAFRVRLDGATGPAGARTPAAAQRGPNLGGGAGMPPMVAQARPAVPAPRQGMDGGRQRVWVLKDGKPAERPVKTGLSDGQKTEILEGLSEGEAVIVGLGTDAKGGSGSTGTPRLRL